MLSFSDYVCGRIWLGMGELDGQLSALINEDVGEDGHLTVLEDGELRCCFASVIRHDELMLDALGCVDNPYAEAVGHAHS